MLQLQKAFAGIGNLLTAQLAVCSARLRRRVPSERGEHGAQLGPSKPRQLLAEQLIDLKEAAAPLGEEGWTLIGVSYDSPEILADFKSAKALPYGLYSDTGSAAIDAFDLRNPDVPAGSRYDGIPHPAIIFISADGTVKAVMREEGYKDRPAVDAVLAMAAAL